MTREIQLIRNFMLENNLEYLLVNSTNKFLVEYNSLEENSRYKLTKFSGSTGDVLVAKDKIFLFVDGRYHIQADEEVNHDLVDVVKMQPEQKMSDEILKRIPEGSVLGIFSQKVSYNMLEKFASKVKLKFLSTDPFDEKIKNNLNEENVDVDIVFCGETSESKIEKLKNTISDDEILYITDLDEVSYLFNKRNFSRQFSSKIYAKAIVSKDLCKLYYPEDFDELETYLRNSTKTVLVDKSLINIYDYELIKDKIKFLEKNPVKIMKSKKNKIEIEHLKEAFKKTDNAVRAIREYIYNNDNISEYDIAQRLEQEFVKQGAKCLSFNSIVAKDGNSALAHYSKSSKDEIITEGSLVLVDCGAYFDGGLATDITRVFVKGQPLKLHKKIYTLVLKAFLLAYNSENFENGYEIHNSVKKFFATMDVEGFVFNHGLGHGIGVNVHEFPPKLSGMEISKVKIEDGMCFSIEPGLYKKDYFGVRLENSCYFENGKIKSFVKMNYEKKLIDFSMLSDLEKKQLSEFEVI